VGFEFTDAHINEYHQLGFTVFRDIISASLLGDLRREADKGREVARRVRGEQAQRLQPLVKYPEIDMKPFDDLYDLPALNDALNRLFAGAFGGPVDPHLSRGLTGVLYEPAGRPWSCGWHRDWRDNVQALDVAEWERKMGDIRLFNQINCALYDDSCTWVVPGSHLRRDTPGEARRFPERPIPKPDTAGMSAEEAERVCREYTTSMPGAFQAHLNAGDYMLYRNTLWHTGNYVPYRRRATIHDGVFSAEYRAFYENRPLRPNKADGSPPDWINPNAVKG
jgi:ectoine hydroxylase-related dioxygenase (phytanoyl-CoA dioxygenase family)